MKKEVKDLFRSIKEVSSNMGWRVYEVGAYLKHDRVALYAAYVGQGIDINVYNKDYDDIVILTEYYKEYANGLRTLSDAVELAVD